MRNAIGLSGGSRGYANRSSGGLRRSHHYNRSLSLRVVQVQDRRVDPIHDANIGDERLVLVKGYQDSGQGEGPPFGDRSTTAEGSIGRLSPLSSNSASM